MPARQIRRPLIALIAGLVICFPAAPARLAEINWQAVASAPVSGPAGPDRTGLANPVADMPLFKDNPSPADQERIVAVLPAGLLAGFGAQPPGPTDPSGQFGQIPAGQIEHGQSRQLLLHLGDEGLITMQHLSLPDGQPPQIDGKPVLIRRITGQFNGGILAGYDFWQTGHLPGLADQLVWQTEQHLYIRETKGWRHQNLSGRLHLDHLASRVHLTGTAEDGQAIRLDLSAGLPSPSGPPETAASGHLSMGEQDIRLDGLLDWMMTGPQASIAAGQFANADNRLAIQFHGTRLP